VDIYKCEYRKNVKIINLPIILSRLRAVPPFRGFRFPGMRKERRDCRQHIKKWNLAALPTQRKIPIGRNRYACQSNLICSNYSINTSRLILYRVYQNKDHRTSALYCIWITAYERDFFIFGKIRLLAVEWHVFHAKGIKNKQVRLR
jgi:hypothetical protein